jgi:hypothetical protein
MLISKDTNVICRAHASNTQQVLGAHQGHISERSGVSERLGQGLLDSHQSQKQPQTAVSITRTG